MARTEAPAALRLCATPRPRPRLAPTTMAWVSSNVGMVWVLLCRCPLCVYSSRHRPPAKSIVRRRSPAPSSRFARAQSGGGRVEAAQAGHRDVHRPRLMRTCRLIQTRALDERVDRVAGVRHAVAELHLRAHLVLHGEATA